VSTKFSEKDVLAIVQEARAEGRKAGEEQLKKLQGQGDKWVVKDGFTGREVGRMLDLCGDAWLVIDAKQQFYRVAKKLSDGDNVQRYRFSCGRNYGGGGMLSIFDMSNRQEISVNEACNRKAREVLERHGIKVLYVHTYID